MGFVEAIEAGRIVKVSEDYARREGLLIVRKKNGATVPESFSPSPTFIKHKDNPLRKDLSPFEKLRKPLGYYKNDVITDLIDNFHWEIVRGRKIKNMARKQLAQAINESEDTVKMIENGMLPKDNYVLVNKIQSALGINLRKDGKTFTAPKIESKPEEKPFISKEEEQKASGLSGEDIEIFE